MAGGQTSIDGTLNTSPTRSPASSPTQSISLTSNRITSVYEIAGVTSTETVPPADLLTQLVTSTWTSNTWLTTTVGGKETIVPVLVGCAHCGGTGRGVIVWNYPPFPDVTFQFPKLPNGDIVDPFHLPCIPIPLIKTCSSPPVDDPPVDGAAGGVDPDPESPDPTSSASSFAASSTSSRQICSFLCSACANNDPPSSYQTPSKLRKRNPQHLEKSFSTYSKHASRFKKRVLPVPDDEPWDGDVATFLYVQIENAEDSGNEVALRGRGIAGISSALAIELRAVSLNMVIQGMYGCTAVFVIADRLVWGSHLWEDEAFKASDAVFKASVLDLLGPCDGTPQMPGLTQFTGAGSRLALATRPKIFIVTPGFVSGSGAMFYPNKVVQLEDTLTGMLGQDVPVKLILYDPVDPPAESDSDGDNDEDVEWTPDGRLLFQYDPVQERCNGIQTAMWRLWIQDELREEFSWPATTDQLVAQRKREEIETAAAVCSASSTTSSSGKTPTGSIYLALIVLQEEVLDEPNGLTPEDDVQYFDEVWEIDGDSKPDYCDNPTWSTLITGGTPNIENPSPTTTITGLQPSGTSGPTCKWIPNPSGSDLVVPGYLSCNADPTSVACLRANAPATTCGNADTEVFPAVQCVWAGA